MSSFFFLRLLLKGHVIYCDRSPVLMFHVYRSLPNNSHSHAFSSPINWHALCLKWTAVQPILLFTWIEGSEALLVFTCRIWSKYALILYLSNQIAPPLQLRWCLLFYFMKKVQMKLWVESFIKIHFCFISWYCFWYVMNICKLIFEVCFYHFSLFLITCAFYISTMLSFLK